MMNFALKMTNSAVKMMNFVLKMMNLYHKCRGPGMASACRTSTRCTWTINCGRSRRWTSGTTRCHQNRWMFGLFIKHSSFLMAPLMAKTIDFVLKWWIYITNDDFKWRCRRTLRRRMQRGWRMRERYLLRGGICRYIYYTYTLMVYYIYIWILMY